MKNLFLAFVLLAAGQSLKAQLSQDTIQMIETAMERYKPSGPGCQLSISRNGKLIYSKAWGMADLEHNAPLSVQSIIEAGSVSKQFTAAAVLLLEQQGKLSLNDPIRKYFPEIPDYGTPITLRQMMQHTSGLKDWGSIAAISGWPRSTKTYANEDALDIISKQKTLNHKPGAEYIYSNSNYNLFALLVERVSGMSLAEFTRVHIFEPAGMKHTSWRDDFKRVVPNRAIAYTKFSNLYFADMPNEYVYGNGGLLTTTEDLLLWNNYYLGGRFGNPSLLSKQTATNRFNNGSPHIYAAGLVINTIRGWKSISHTGATGSYRASLEHFPDLGLSIAWLSNSSEFDNAADAAGMIRSILVPDRSASQAPLIAEQPLPATTLNAYSGWYRNSRTATGVKLSVKDGHLASNTGWDLRPTGNQAFYNLNDKVEFKNGNMYYYAPGDTVSFIRSENAGTSITEYAGTYISDEAGAKYTIRVQDGKLMANVGPGNEILLSPTYKDGFSTRAGTIYFKRTYGKISGFAIYSSRARNVVFIKK